jgi:hypothetical protein
VVSNFCKLKSFIDKKSYDVDQIQAIYKTFFAPSDLKPDSTISSIPPSIGSKEYKPLFNYCFFVTVYALMREKLGYQGIEIKV